MTSNVAPAVSTLTAVPDTGSDTSESQQPHKDSETSKYTSILIVEDETGVRELLKQLLDLEGYHTTSVENGSEGVSMFQREHHDLVFTDFRMPGMSGAEVAKAIKTLSAQTPVVIVTGWDPDVFAEELRNSGVDRIVKKPFDMDEILDLVTDLTQ